MRKIAALPILAALLAGAGFFAARTPSDDHAPENQVIATFAAGAVSELAKAYPDSAKKTVPRDAHPKAHGCVKAIFQVDPALPQDLRVGTFSQPAQRFEALIRFSNGASTPGPDSRPDFRGMALKLIDADPDRADATRANPARQRPPHDILMVDYPQFFLAGLADLRALVRAGAFRADGDALQPYFFPSANPFGWRLREAWIAYRTATQKIASPLRADYFSQTPYRFGPDQAIKYAVRPCAALSAPAPAPDDPDSLRHALQRRLKAAPACFELFVQQRSGDLGVDDATQLWPQAQSPLRRIGRIDIPSQDVSAPGHDALCENLSFNPGHAPTELAPLGAINRAREEIYARIAAYRFARNGVTPIAAETAWDRF